MSTRSPFVVVANRLPVDQETLPDGSVRWHRSPGGLVSALEPVMRSQDGIWVGWAGATGDAPEPFTADGIRMHAVALSAAEVSGYYEGFSNGTLWPLYHDVIATPEYHRGWWDSYVEVNRRFAEVAAEVAAEGGVVWVQDYQLQLVPQMLRERRPDLRIGFFLHIPFPPPELFMQLPWRARVVQGLLGADLIGFQLPGGAANFLRLARSLHGLRPHGSAVEVGGRTVRAQAFPISIDTASLETVAREDAVRRRAAEIRRELGNPEHVLLGVDRLDYTKGIGIRLKAFHELLQDGTLAVPDVVLVQVATPSRERVEHYKVLRDEIEREVGRINGDYGKVGIPAVHYLHQSYSREELTALYRAADVMLVTPLRDGMNLVAKEYVASRVDTGGALVLSEFTGAAAELRQAYLVNPHDIDGLKDTMVAAIAADPADARRRMRRMRRQVVENDVSHWARTFLDALGIRAVAGGAAPPETVEAQRAADALHSADARRTADVVGAADTPGAGATRAGEADGASGTDAADHVAGPADPADAGGGDRLEAAVRRLAHVPTLVVACDFDGTLAPIVDDPALARPLPAAVVALRALAALPRTEVVLVSGRARQDLARFSGLGGEARLVGSHGAELDADLAGEVPADAVARRTAVLDAVRAIVEGVDGARLEEKPISVAVHVRNADPADAERVLRAVAEGPGRIDGVHAQAGKQVLELAVVSTSKGDALAALRSRLGADAVFFAGDDVTDEKGFTELGPDDVGVKVGPGDTAAEHRVADPEAVTRVLALLAEARRAAVGP